MYDEKYVKYNIKFKPMITNDVFTMQLELGNFQGENFEIKDIWVEFAKWDWSQIVKFNGMLILLEVNKGIVHTFQVIKISEKIGHIHLFFLLQNSLNVIFFIC